MISPAEQLREIWREVLPGAEPAPEASFFALGGTSLLATRLLARLLQTFGLELTLLDVFENPTFDDLGRLVAERLVSDPSRLARIPEAASYELSSSQRRLWIVQELLEQKDLYNIARSFALRGNLDSSVLRRAFAALAERHESLRTRFGLEGQIPRQHVESDPVLDFQELDLRHVRGLDVVVEELKREEAMRPFQLDVLPLFRVRLLRLGEDEHEHELLFTIHHIVADGWSLHVLFRDLWALYTGLSLPPLAIHYRDFAAWQNARLAGGDLDRQRQYWHRRLSGEIPVLDLPSDVPRPAVQTYDGARVRLHIPEEIRAGLKQVAEQQRVTLYMALLAVVNLVLYRNSGQTRIALGAPVSGRPRAELEDQVGFYVNTLVLIQDVDPRRTFAQLLHDVRRTVLAAHENQDYPFDTLVDDLKIERNTSRHPLFDVLVTLNEPGVVAGPARLPGLAIRPTRSGYELSKFDLSIGFDNLEDALILTLKSNRGLFRPERMERLARQLVATMERVIEDPDGRVGEIPVAPPEDPLAVLAGPCDERPPGTVVDWLAERAGRWPGRTAVEAGGERLTYAELEERSSRLAVQLRDRGAGPDRVVGVCAEPSLDMLVSVLGVLKSGAACMPLDPGLPRERLELLIADSGACLVVGSPSPGGGWVGDGRGGQGVRTQGDDLAYIIYTSGSTGVPKGVAMPHRCLANLLSWQMRQPGFDRPRRTLQVSHFGFDVFFQEVLATWLTGSTLVVAERGLRGDPEAFVAVLEEQRIERLFLPPVLLQHVAEAAGEGVRLTEVVAAGERLLVTPAIRRMLASGCRLINQYGPSESHVVTSCDLGTDAASWPDHPPIGRPVAHTRIHLLDGPMQPVSPGVPGEIYIAGENLARGYLGRPRLTAERFVPDPFATEPGERLYRTGDSARLLWSGELEFLGRLDDQLKIRGFRVEPGEIEAALERHPAVRECAVIEDPGRRGERLIAYVIPQVDIDQDALRSFLAAQLPAYMIPSLFVALPAFPLTASGKVDRRRLPAPVEDGSGRGCRPAETPLQERLVACWETVLGRRPVGILDNFFELGGHSLLLVRLLAEIRERAGVQVSMAMLWRYPTIEALAARLEEGGARVEGERTRFVELQVEARLPEDLTPWPPLPSPPRRPGEGEPPPVLLTGATGFVGAFLLREILDRTSGPIHCLVRAKSAREGASRLRSVLESYGLWRSEARDRIVAVPGDLTRPRLGLSEEGFSRLAGQIGAIVHCGASVHFTSPFAVSRAANVEGTIEVLRLSAAAGGVPVHAISTVGIFSVPDCEHSETASIDDQRHSIVNGYAASKWVAEKLLQEARGRGVPTSIYRLGRVTGHSVTGAANLRDFFHRLLAGALRMGTFPEELEEIEIDLTPVDWVARAVVEMVSRPADGATEWHLVNPRRISYRKILETFERTVVFLPFRVWLRQIEEHGCDEGSPFHLIAPVLRDPDYLGKIRTEARRAVSVRASVERLLARGIGCPAPDERLLATYGAYLQSRMGELWA
ncbi:MAG TPA: amino acid adenylation domain-containing protein [Thermoanaerobaculia bacterium]|nr:amino acid adenylation domain-containing protein [Thermoanaerobaculia bacterium]